MLWNNKDLKWKLSNNKIPKGELLNFSREIFEKESTIYLPKNIIVIDVDEQKSRDILFNAKGLNYLSELVYSYNKETNSFHFYFSAPSNLKLSNKHTYLTASNLKVEVLLDKVVFNKENYEFSKNFQSTSELPKLDILFFPVKDITSEKDILFNNVENTITNLENAREGDKRSKNLFSLTSNLLSKSKYYKLEYTKNDFEMLYNFYNEFILADALTRSEVSNNVGQLFKDKTTRTNTSNDAPLISSIITTESTSKNGNTFVKYTFSDVLFAKVLINKYHICKYNSQIYLYLENKYIPFENSYLDRVNLFNYICEIEINKLNNYFLELGNDTRIELTQTRYNEIKNQVLLKSKYLEINETSNDIRVKNGILKWNKELEKYELIYSNSLYNEPIFTSININYVKSTLYNEKVDKFLNEIFKRPDIQEMENLIKVFYEMLGCVLVDNASYRSAFLFKGYKGRNGKSTLLQLISRFVGSKNVSSLKYEQLTGEGFALSNLRNKKVNLTDEMPSKIDADNGTIKSLISGGIISTDIKFEPISQWKNFATLIFATNYNLKVQKFNSAISDRFYIIELLNQFSAEKGTDVKNKHEQVLSTDADYEYLLQKAVEALTRLIKNNWNFTPTKGNNKHKLEMILDNEPILNWLYTLEYLDENLMLNKSSLSVKENFLGTSLKDLLEQFKYWYNDYYGKECLYGMYSFKEKLMEIGASIMRGDNRKELVAYE